MLLSFLHLQFVNVHYKLECFTGKSFQPTLMFAGMARAYPSDAPYRCCAIGLALPTNIRPDWKGLPWANTLAYYEHS